MIARSTEDRLSITIESSRLVSCGMLDAGGSERLFMHLGIANRRFKLSFVLANGIEVGVTALECGQLRTEIGGGDDQ